MSWETLLYLSILGPVVTISAFAVVGHLGVRYRRELPKLPIKESIEALKLEREELEARLGELQDRHADALEAIREGERMRVWLDNHGPELEQAQREIADAQDTQRAAEAQREKAVSALDAVRAEIDRTRDILDSLERELTPRRSELAALTQQIEKAQRDLADYETRKNELQAVESRLPDLRKEFENLQETVAKLKSEAESLDSELIPIRHEHAKLAGEVAGMEQRRTSLEASIEDLKEIQTAVGGASPDHDPLEDLWTPYFKVRSDSGSQTNERDLLQSCHQALEPAGIRIPRRTLFAFHTALKVQEISPLTVLAGISGTGKSLLPRLYARCMGIHFLNLPVQPGWSSPQDLFGFYNYIEQKFKATPLARAMIQFDQYNRDSWQLGENNPALDDQVLMVLLDEMNLARVEYYFSELLSRLETRRSIDPSVPTERQKVEVPLEIGHGSRGRAGLSIYPGDNVLFAGTMNEDESTMSLSDKVLDRATVLRFGRPAQIRAEAPDVSSIHEADKLALSTWRQWMTRSEIQPTVRNALHNLEEVMFLAGSPYGHRVAQGMLSYVASYPDDSVAGQRHALADQVEQKVLPKLRGRELHNIEPALSRLEDILKELSDGELIKALQQGRDATEGTFMWTGIDREQR